ncbi:MAG: hypothetical protein WCH43_15315 [Verrucomicrobiota bacterium]
MKWTTLLLICGIALVFDACQKHSVQELKLLQPAHSESTDGKPSEAKGKSAADVQKP